MNSNDRYTSTMENLTNSRKNYHKAHLTFLEAKVAFQEAEKKFKKAEERKLKQAAKLTSLYAEKLERQKAVIASVINKHNAGRLYSDQISAPGYEWTSYSGAIEIVNLTETHVTFRFQNGTARDGSKTYSQEFTLKRTIFTASDRELAGEVRAKLKDIRDRRNRTVLAEKRAKAIEERRKVAASIAYEERKLKELRKKQALLEKRIERKS